MSPSRPASQILHDVAYAQVSPRQTLDLHLPATDGAFPVPLVVLLHPGGFQFGTSRMERPIAQALVAQGFAAASVNYRLSAEARYPAGARDVKAAVRWLRAHSDEYGWDEEAIAAWGRSAGGWMALMLGVTGDQDTRYDDPSLGHADRSARVQAVVAWYPLTDFGALDEHAAALPPGLPVPMVHGEADSFVSLWLGEAVHDSPLTPSTNLASYLPGATDLPAFHLVHGEVDTIVAPGQSRAFADAVEAVGGSVSLTIFPGAEHADPRLDRAQRRPSIDFLRRTLGPRRPRGHRRPAGP